MMGITHFHSYPNVKLQTPQSITLPGGTTEGKRWIQNIFQSVVTSKTCNFSMYEVKLCTSHVLGGKAPHLSAPVISPCMR